MDRLLAAVIILTSAVFLTHSVILVDSRRFNFRLLSSSSSPASADLTPANLPPPPHRAHRTHPRPHNGKGSSRSRRQRREKRRDELGRKMGVVFAGIALLLQLALGVFLCVKRWQISKMGANTS